MCEEGCVITSPMTGVFTTTSKGRTSDNEGPDSGYGLEKCIVCGVKNLVAEEVVSRILSQRYTIRVIAPINGPVEAQFMTL